MRTIYRLMGVLVALVTISTAAEARYDCGRVQARHFGVGSAVALDWAKDFQHVSAQVGAVVVQTRPGRAQGGGPGGHVSRIVQIISQCRAIVADDKGQYERDICSRLVAYVMPSGGQRLAHSEQPRVRHAERVKHHSRHAGHHHRGRHYGRTQVVSAEATDRFRPE